MKKLHAILIGINKYPTRPLNGCLNDVKNVKKYLTEKIQDRFKEKPSIVELVDEKATKSRILAEIDNLRGVGDDETVLIYFSGHGAQEIAHGEETKGIFKNESDGLLECLVCYDKEKSEDEGKEIEKEVPHHLADKEIRYALSKFKNNPHLVTIFDCCHSGDMTKGDEDELKVRKIYDGIPARPYNEFDFHQDHSIKEIRDNGRGFEGLVTLKNHIHIAACLPTEESIERPLYDPFETAVYDKDSAEGEKERTKTRQGVLTNYLLTFLLASNSNVNYSEITSWANVSFHSVSYTKQTPNIAVLGTKSGSLSKASKWLGVARLDEKVKNTGKAYYNSRLGWHYDRGSLWGIKEEQEISIKLDNGKEVKATVSEIDINRSSLKVDSDELDRDRATGYEAYVSDKFTTYDTLKIYLNNLSEEEDSEELNKAGVILQEMGNEGHLKLVQEKNEAHFFLNDFNHSLYFSFADDEFQYRPLAKQLDLLREETDIKDFLDYQVPYLQKWNHYKSLKNPTQSYTYNRMPIKIEIQLEENGDWVELGDNDYIDIIPDERGGENGEFSKAYNFRISRNLTSSEPIYVGAYFLWANMSITVRGNVHQLVNNASSVNLYEDYFFGNNGPALLGRLQLERVNEFYNWKHEPVSLKLIVANDNFDFDDEMKQGGLDLPIMHDIPMGEGPNINYQEFRKVWQVYTVNFRVINPTYNRITGELEKYGKDAVENELLAGFIEKLYFSNESYQFKINPSLKPNSEEDGSLETENTKSLKEWGLKVMNGVFNGIRRRRYKWRLKVKPKLEVIVAEGDSWFLFPLPGVRDTLTYINRQLNIRSFADAGDELRDYYLNQELIMGIEQLDPKPRVILLSGGGNDVIGPEISRILIAANFRNRGLPIGNYVNLNEFNNVLEELRQGYEFFITEIQNLLGGDDFCIFIHGYDFIRANPPKRVIKNGWANKYMMQAGIYPDDRERVINHLVTGFNDMLEELSEDQRFANNVVYVNNLNTLGDDEWRDEIHPDNGGYKKVANNFIAAINARFKGINLKMVP